MNTSDSTPIRSFAHAVAEIAQIRPVSAFDLKSDYSPFASDDYNEKLHERAVDQVFEDVMRQARRQRSAEPLTDTANSQNLKLQSGHLLGWCAGALQAAALAWIAAAQGNGDTSEAARREFEVERSRTSWRSLRDLSRKIIERYRENSPVTLGTLLEMNKNDRHAATLMKSIEATMADHERRKDEMPEIHAGISPAARRPAAAAPAPGDGEIPDVSAPRSRRIGPAVAKSGEKSGK